MAFNESQETKKILNEIKLHIESFSLAFEKDKTLEEKKYKKELKHEKRDRNEKIKEKSLSKKKVIETSDSVDSEKDISAFSKTLNDSFTKLGNFTSPGNLVKISGLLSNSPLLMMAGQQLDQMKETYNTERQKEKENLKIIKNSQKSNFLNERKEEEANLQRQRQNDLLEKISDNTEDMPIRKKTSGKGAGIFGLLAGIFSLSKLKGLKNILGKGVTKGLFKGILKKGFLLNFGKGLLRGLVRFIALPITAIFAAFDFYKGFKDSENITGKKGLEAKIQGGISQMISGFTFGLIDPKFISGKIDEGLNYVKGFFPVIKEKFFNFILAPLNLIKNLFSGEKGIVDSFVQFTSDLTTLSPETLTNMFSLISEKFKSLISEPFNYIKDYISNLWDNIKPIIDDYVIDIKEKMFEFKDNFKNILTNPFKTVKNLFRSEDGTKSLKDTGFKKDLKQNEPVSKPYINIASKLLDNIMKSKKEDKKQVENTIVQQNNAVNHSHIQRDMRVFSDDHSVYNPVAVF